VSSKTKTVCRYLPGGGASQFSTLHRVLARNPPVRYLQAQYCIASNGSRAYFVGAYTACRGGTLLASFCRTKQKNRMKYATQCIWDENSPKNTSKRIPPIHPKHAGRREQRNLFPFVGTRVDLHLQAYETIQNYWLHVNSIDWTEINVQRRARQLDLNSWNEEMKNCRDQRQQEQLRPNRHP